MRTRIIFRGLTLFRFEQSTRDAKANDNLGELTACLVSNPMHKGKGGLHEHKPFLGWIGREYGARPGLGRAQTKLPVPPRMKLELKGDPNAPTGVIADGSFLDYVPHLGALAECEPHNPLREDFITRKIVIPNGRIRAREFISWDWYGDAPARVAYMGTKFQGFGTNEVIVDIGDDSDTDADSDDKYLLMTDLGTHEKPCNEERKLWPYTKGADYADDIDPNTVEILVTNLTARRRRPVFWGLHYTSLFEAAGFSPSADYTTSPQYEALVDQARRYDPDEWDADVAMTKDDRPFPFPFLTDINRQLDKLPGIKAGDDPYILTGPLPPGAGRQKGEGIPTGGVGGVMGGMLPSSVGSPMPVSTPPAVAGGGMGMGHDPENTYICPHGRD